MKKDIQPEYKRVQVTCACGNTFETGSVTDKDEKRHKQKGRRRYKHK
ncbi:MAG: 50S ribosomal protein L31 [Tissierellales bacterium]|nr:50S ribosomal protein L31 [Tissierellales bacterium]